MKPLNHLSMLLVSSMQLFKIVENMVRLVGMLIMTLIRVTFLYLIDYLICI
jgi:hypothetical protein